MESKRSTLVGTPVVVAPGKIFLVGEYAILEEGPAVLAAINRHAVAQYVPGLDPVSKVVEEAVSRARAAIGEAAAALPPGSVMVDTDELRHDGQKLGLGSSAATAVAAVGALFEAAGIAIAKNRDKLLDVALGAHRAAQRQLGSGADVVAAVHGGLLKVVRPQGGPLTTLPLPVPSGLRLVVFWTGDTASTPRLLEAVQRFARSAPAAHREIMASLQEIAGRFVTELKAGNATAAVAAAERYGKRLEVLGTAASVPIVTPACKHAGELAKELGGTAKPSGAGGGDIGIAMFATPEAARLFARALTKPLVPLGLDLDRTGVRRRVPDEPEVESSGLFHG